MKNRAFPKHNDDTAWFARPLLLFSFLLHKLLKDTWLNPDFVVDVLICMQMFLAVFANLMFQTWKVKLPPLNFIL